jgi:23S rRNA pseudouridine1911/1915/1917 synthase
MLCGVDAVCEFRVLDESSDWIVVDKPAPLIVHPANGRTEEPSLLGGLRALLACELAGGARLFILTRLDRETSGLVLVAKHRVAARELARNFESRMAVKEYLAIVHGWPRRDEWTEVGPILRAGEIGPGPIWLRQMVHRRGRSCVTRFVVERRLRVRGRRVALVRCLPQTGRMHQIRVHLESAGHALVGDKIYGTDGAPYLQRMSGGIDAAMAERLLLPRHALHACLLSLSDQGRWRSWECPLAEDLTRFLAEPTVETGHGDTECDRGLSLRGTSNQSDPGLPWSGQRTANGGA